MGDGGVGGAFQLPVGTVTFLLTDVAGSTRLWQSAPDAMPAAMARHYEILHEIIGRGGGVRPIEQGEGDSIVAAFSRPSDAVRAAIEMQRAMLDESWPTGAELSIRIGLHTGEAQLRDEGNYFGAAIARCARVRSAGHGGQTLLSQAARDLVIDHLPEAATLLDLGTHRLKDLARPEHVFQLCHPELPARFPPITSLDALPNNLPAQLTSFIGREEEIERVAALLENSRLITLTGAGGCGKTRLALQVAADVAERYPDGIWWVELAPITESHLVPHTLASALSLRDAYPTQPLIDSVKDHLRGRTALIVLDNCEHLIAASAEVTEGILRACPGVSIVATSREPLGVDGETSWRVPSLSLPEEKPPATIEALRQCEAVRLFIDRALRSRPNFRITNDNAPAVAEVCARLDGIPLAIELAAARVRLLTPERILEGLSDRFALLTGGARTALPRQRTLEASVDWSYNLLNEDERSLLRRLSVFAGDFALDAAEAVCSSDEIEPPAILDLLSQLVDRSLVQVEEQGGEVRYRLLETIRQYAWSKLSGSDEEVPVRDRHLAYYLHLAEGAEKDLEGPRLPQALDLLEAELDNLRAAMEWALRQARVDDALRIPSAIHLFWQSRASTSEALRWLDAALALDGAEPRWRAKALVVASGIRAWFFDHEAIAVAANEALAIGRALGDEGIMGRAYEWMGWSELFVDASRTRDLFEQALMLFRRAGEHWHVAQTLLGIGFLDIIQGDNAAAETVLKESLAVAEQNGDVLNTREALCWLGFSLFFLGRFKEARAALDRSLEIVHGIREQFFEAYVLAIMGILEAIEGRFEEGREKLARSEQLALESGNKPAMATQRANLGALELWAGRLAEAEPALEEALGVFRMLQVEWFTSQALMFLGWRAYKSGDFTDAHTRLEEALILSRSAKNAWSIGRTLLGQAGLARVEGNLDTSENLAHEALTTLVDAGDLTGIVDTLESLAIVAVARESFAEGGRLFGVVRTMREELGYPRQPLLVADYEGAIDAIRSGLGEEGLDVVLAEGAALATPDAVSYARRARGERKRPSSGWDSLTPTELDVVRLAAHGLTNPQIGEKLFITRGTVKVHLAHVFTKLGVATRAELAAEATKRGI